MKTFFSVVRRKKRSAGAKHPICHEGSAEENSRRSAAGARGSLRQHGDVKACRKSIVPTQQWRYGFQNVGLGWTTSLAKGGARANAQVCSNPERLLPIDSPSVAEVAAPSVIPLKQVLGHRYRYRARSTTVQHSHVRRHSSSSRCH